MIITRGMAAVMGLVLAACGDVAQLTVLEGTGPQPRWVAPHPTLIPTVNIAPARGWHTGAQPQAAAGTKVNAFATALEHPRWLLVLPNGDVLVAETNAPARADAPGGLTAWFKGWAMRRAGAAGASANRITLLRDSQGHGVADVRSVLLDGLNSPFGMALVGTDLYVANTDAVLRFPYTPGQTRITAPGVVVARLPAGPINHHWTKNLIASADGRKLYVTVGSNSNVAEQGMAAEVSRAAILEVDLSSGAQRVFASGLRNPNGLAWAPGGALWVVVNERDELGSDLVPDYLREVRDGGFYGWPYSYFGRHVDERVQPQRPDLVAQALIPDYALGPHTASLGLVAANGNRLPQRFAQGMFVAQHGSWNRRPHSGYQVIFVPFEGERPTGEAPLPVLTGFLDAQGQAQGRPVGLALDGEGALLVADDVGRVIWRVSAQPGAE